MINLIPNEEKKRMARDFYRRFAVLFLYMLSFCAVVLLVAVLPSYIISLLKVSSANSKLEAQRNEPVPELDQATQAEIVILDKKLSLVEKAETEKFFVSQSIISEIVLNKMADIKINRISYEITGKDLTKKVTLAGTAESRERLLLFREVLEANKAFKSVDLPISNFIKGSDIQFNLNLVPA